MLDLVKSIAFHRWLFGFAIGLTLAAVPHAVWVFEHRLPSALLNLHLVTAVGLFLYAEMRRQWTARARSRDELVHLVVAAERR